MVVLDVIKNFANEKREGYYNLKVYTRNYDESVLLGEIIGSTLKMGDILCLDGDLGAGKTALTGGIASGLGIKGRVASPTFTILMEHTKTRSLPLFHFDAYRLDSEDDFYDLGFEEYLAGEGVCVIEWANRIKDAIPDNAIWLDLKRTSFDITDERLIIFYFLLGDERGKDFEGLLQNANFEFG